MLASCDDDDSTPNAPDAATSPTLDGAADTGNTATNDAGDVDADAPVDAGLSAYALEVLADSPVA